MAEATDVEFVKESMPGDIAGTYTDVKIGEMLDSGNTVNKVLSRIWHAQAARTASFVSVTESGSSRDLSTIHRNAVSMATYWDEQVAREEKPDRETAAKAGVRIYTATRV